MGKADGRLPSIICKDLTQSVEGLKRKSMISKEEEGILPPDCNVIFRVSSQDVYISLKLLSGISNWSSSIIRKIAVIINNSC